MIRRHQPQFSHSSFLFTPAIWRKENGKTKINRLIHKGLKAFLLQKHSSAGARHNTHTINPLQTPSIKRLILGKEKCFSYTPDTPKLFPNTPKTALRHPKTASNGQKTAPLLSKTAIFASNGTSPRPLLSVTYVILGPSEDCRSLVLIHQPESRLFYFYIQK
jgi:hypothetical protein